MSTFPSPQTGPPTFTAASASLNLSGLDFAPLAASDIMDPEWYSQDDYDNLRVHAQPAMSTIDDLSVSAAFALPSHNAQAASGDFAGGQADFSFSPILHFFLRSLPISSSLSSHVGPNSQSHCKRRVARIPASVGVACRHRASLHAIPRDFPSHFISSTSNSFPHESPSRVSNPQCKPSR
jgi:hypothetical protein